MWRNVVFIGNEPQKALTSHCPFQDGEVVFEFAAFRAISGFPHVSFKPARRYQFRCWSVVHAGCHLN